MAVIYAMNVLLERFFGVYERWQWFDVPMHFVGGFAAGLLGVSLHFAGTSAKQRRELPSWYQLLFVLGITMFVAVTWEWHEFVRDWIHHGQAGWTWLQPSTADTMKDLLMGLLGGLVAASLLKKE